jgi:hypothetical protein
MSEKTLLHGFGRDPRAKVSHSVGFTCHFYRQINHSNQDRLGLVCHSMDSQINQSKQDKQDLVCNLTHNQISVSNQDNPCLVCNSKDS